MRTPADHRLRDEAQRFALRFACDDCAHFDADNIRCAHEYPLEPRRDALAMIGPNEPPPIAFCKEFELG